MNLIVKWLLYASIIYIMGHIIPGIQIAGFVAALITAVIMGLVNIFISPLVKLLSLPINFITFGLFNLVINAIMLFVVSLLSPGFQVCGLFACILGSLFIAFSSFFIEKIGA